MDFASVAAAVDGVPYMTPEHGRRVYDHIRRSGARDVLELGTAHGVSACYLAAALEAGGEGKVTTVDHAGAAYEPGPEEVVERAGLSHRVEIVRAHSSYNWFLKERIEERTDATGVVDPQYDFCYLDGSKNLNVDGLAVVLVEKLLRPGGWLLMDDLDWTYALNRWIEPHSDGRPLGPMSEPERSESHLRAVFDVVVTGLPSFTHMVVENEWYGWARKDPGAPRRYEVKNSVPPLSAILGRLRRRARG